MLEKLPDADGNTTRNQCVGLDEIACSLIQLKLAADALPIDVQSTAFSNHEPIPAQYTADGLGISPPLQWTGVPPQAATLVLIIEDADAPTTQPLTHAIVADLEPEDLTLPAGALQSPGHAAAGLDTVRNAYLQANWIPPDPPPGSGVHRYAFQLFALSAGPDFPEAPTRELVIEILRERAIASGCLIGTYQRTHADL
jgi:Raf kinase inhibitor-like YbhB/YbcL family protein